MKRSDYRFEGTGTRPAGEPHPDSPTTPEPYKADPKLVQAVNLAIYLGRPLLLEGEAGSGKTRLARAVAYELGLPYYLWNVRSTSKAQEGLYTYDSVLRLHDVYVKQYLGSREPGGESRDAGVRGSRLARKSGGAKQARGAQGSDAASVRDPERAEDYVKWGALGRAFQTDDRPAVVLIDEIDKADLDFPNDLLTVLDDPWEFPVPELGGRVVRAAQPPIVLITSNKEKGNLPMPFLRRCVYFFVEFPDDETRLREIVDIHYKLRRRRAPKAALVKAAASRFLALRRDGGLHKKPGTSEFLDWVEAIHGLGGGDEVSGQLASGGPLPYPEVLLKLRADWQRGREATA